MIPPVSLDSERSHLTTMPVLPQLRVWFCLELDHVCSASVLKAERLDVDRAAPQVPVGVFLGVDVHVGAAKALGDVHLAELVVAHAVVLP